MRLLNERIENPIKEREILFLTIRIFLLLQLYYQNVKFYFHFLFDLFILFFNGAKQKMFDIILIIFYIIYVIFKKNNKITIFNRI
jgi:uncharacterized membrane protein YkvA (DUF1232 family)